MRSVPSPPTPIRDTAATDRPLPGADKARRRRRWLIAGGALALVGLAALAVVRWASAERAVAGARLRLAEVTRGTLVRDAAVNGRVVAAVSPTLYAPVAGTVTLQIRAGDTVAKDQIVATIDSPELDSELEREQATLAQLEAQLGAARIATDQTRLTARREADEAEIALTTAERELQGAERAFQLGAIPEVDYLRAKDAVKSARVRHEHARAAADLTKKSAGFDLETVKKQHERQRLAVAELVRRVDELRVRAPVAGVVGTVAIADRAMVAGNAPLMTVVDLARLEVELEVPETYADDLGLGTSAEVRLGTTTAAGTLAAISPEVVDNHVLARVRFEGAQPAGLRQSQRVAARILIEERPDVVMVPRGPFVEDHGGRAIYVVDGDLATRRAIRVGATSVGAVEILEGVQPGERVVIAGSDLFDDASTVRIND